VSERIVDLRILSDLMGGLNVADHAGFVGGSKDELGALKARQIIARGEASGASKTPGHLAKIDASPERAKDISLALTRAGINPLLYQGFRSLRSLHPWLLSIALTALPKRHPQIQQDQES
jgi:hypothetical protein